MLDVPVLLITLKNISVPKPPVLQSKLWNEFYCPEEKS